MGARWGLFITWANRTVCRNMSRFWGRSIYAPQRPRSQEGRFRCDILLHICDIIIISKGAWKVPTSAPVYLRHVHLPGAPLTTHAREQQEAHLRAPALLRINPPCPRRARFDQNNQAWRTWSLLWGKEAVQNVCGSEQEQKTMWPAQKCARVPSAAFLVVIPRPRAPARVRKRVFLSEQRAL